MAERREPGRWYSAKNPVTTRSDTGERVGARRAGAQLLGRPLGAVGPEAVVRRLLAVQAQDLRSAALAIHARGGGPDAAAVHRALARERSLVRLWALRGTLHLVAAQDAGWLLGLLAPALLRAAPRRLRQLGVADADAKRAVAVIERALAEHGPLPRSALAEHLAAANIETAGQATIHLIRLAALHGVCLAGPDETFVLWRDWLGEPPRPPDADIALAELARRHHAAHAPADAQDLAAWSGLGLRECRRAWTLARDSRAQVSTVASDTVRLLPAWDELLLGWRDRDPVLPPEHATRVQRGGGILRPTVLHGGRIIATWRPERRPGRITVTVEPFTADPDPAVTASLTAAVQETGAFEGREPTLTIG